jgi:hypothetical protein
MIGRRLQTGDHAPDFGAVVNGPQANGVVAAAKNVRLTSARKRSYSLLLVITDGVG